MEFLCRLCTVLYVILYQMLLYSRRLFALFYLCMCRISSCRLECVCVTGSFNFHIAWSILIITCELDWIDKPLSRSVRLESLVISMACYHSTSSAVALLLDVL